MRVEKAKHKTQIVEINLSLSTITLNVHRVNSLIKGQRLAEWP